MHSRRLPVVIHRQMVYLVRSAMDLQHDKEMLSR